MPRGHAFRRRRELANYPSRCLILFYKVFHGRVGRRKQAPVILQPSVKRIHFLEILKHLCVEYTCLLSNRYFLHCHGHPIHLWIHLKNESTLYSLVRKTLELVESKRDESTRDGIYCMPVLFVLERGKIVEELVLAKEPQLLLVKISSLDADSGSFVANVKNLQSILLFVNYTLLDILVPLGALQLIV